MNENRYGILSSSVDPAKLALTVRGFLKLAMGLLVSFGLVEVTDANTLTESIVAMIPLAIALYGLVQTIVGIVRKILVRLGVV
jgi:hypothetical protein